ncbi:unnamed protein product [Blepharisma stoltei]|uniref:Uncharacterized protein n=1 Tax=Blepharisma stoltei TaxID=1481888 RepID=A0AAU9K3P0_9CILI|nr:unnamed protein product [Blepharisma stoltei]
MVTKTSELIDAYLGRIDSEDMDFNHLPTNDLNYHFYDDTNYFRHSSKCSDMDMESPTHPSQLSSHRRSSSFDSILGHCLRNATCITSLNPRFAVKLDSAPLQDLITSRILESSAEFF